MASLTTAQHIKFLNSGPKSNRRFTSLSDQYALTISDERHPGLDHHGHFSNRSVDLK